MADGYTTDPGVVVGVVWSVASEMVKDVDESGEYIDGPDDAAKMQRVLNRIAEGVIALYPSCVTVQITDGGFENQFARMAPIAYTREGVIYEPFFDDMLRLEDEAIAAG
jgi:hypothetical protein